MLARGERTVGGVAQSIGVTEAGEDLIEQIDYSEPAFFVDPRRLVGRGRRHEQTNANAVCRAGDVS